MRKQITHPGFLKAVLTLDCQREGMLRPSCPLEYFCCLFEACSAVQGLVEAAVTRDDYDAALTAIAVWLRFSSARHLIWNRNYNVKPREIGAAQV